MIASVLPTINWSAWLTPERIENIIRMTFLLLVVLPSSWLLARFVGKIVARKSSAHYGLLTRRLIAHTCTVIIAIMILWDLGFQLTPLLSAAGIIGVAVGFAAQTTLSNFISGLFLLTEKPFSVGDVLTVGDITGAVLSIDLMSVKLRTFDNRFVRIPSAHLIQEKFINVTRFPIRRLDIQVGVAYKEDITRVKAVIKDVTDKNPFCLDEPAPVIIFQNYGDSALEFLLGAWCAQADLLPLRNSLMQELKERFDAEGIEIPFPHRSLYTGEATRPFPIRIVQEPDPQAPPAKT